MNKFLCRRHRPSVTTLYFALGVILFLAVGPSVVWAQPEPASSVTSVDGKRIAIPEKDLGTAAKFYAFKTKNNVTVRFFAILDNQKQAHVAFDACDVCFQAKRGYRIVSGFAICNNCGQRFPLTAIGKDNLRGGCWPSYLPMSAADGKIGIAVADIEKKVFLFR